MDLHGRTLQISRSESAVLDLVENAAFEACLNVNRLPVDPDLAKNPDGYCELGGCGVFYTCR
jgi:hypothetical protein